MDIKELRKKISTSSNIEWFNTIESIIDFSYIYYKQTFVGIIALYEFLNNEIKWWDKYEENLPTELKSSRRYFINTRDTVDNLINTYIDNPENGWQDVLNQLNSRSEYPIPYNNPNTLFILDTYLKFWALTASWSFMFLLEGRFDSNRGKDYTIGWLLAYEFLMKESSIIWSRRNIEKLSLNQLHQNYEKLILEWTNQVSNHIKNTTEKYEEYIKTIDTLKLEKNNIFEGWFQEATEKQLQLESTYKEKLKLSEPAEYWKERSTKLMSEWNYFAFTLFIITLIISYGLYFLIFHTPDVIIDLFTSNNYRWTIKWSILFITFISFCIYIVRILARAMLSTYHLGRDAEERYSLTYFYLALSKDVTVEKEERLLVMQSLFSRSDSGLLNTDSGPTLPSTVFENIIKLSK